MWSVSTKGPLPCHLHKISIFTLFSFCPVTYVFRSTNEIASLEQLEKSFRFSYTLPWMGCSPITGILSVVCHRYPFIHPDGEISDVKQSFLVPTRWQGQASKRLVWSPARYPLKQRISTFSRRQSRNPGRLNHLDIESKLCKTSYLNSNLRNHWWPGRFATSRTASLVPSLQSLVTWLGVAQPNPGTSHEDWPRMAILWQIVTAIRYNTSNNKHTVDSSLFQAFYNKAFSYHRPHSSFSFLVTFSKFAFCVVGQKWKKEQKNKLKE